MRAETYDALNQRSATDRLRWPDRSTALGTTNRRWTDLLVLRLARLENLDDERLLTAFADEALLNHFSLLKW